MMNDTIVEQQPDLKTLTERFTARAVEFIHEKKEKPFFLYFAHIAETELSGNVIEGMDMYDFLIGKSSSLRDEFVYYCYDSLYAIRK